MKISCIDTGKRYNRDWIFRNFTYHFEFPGHYAITGPNGSGKSTLLQVIAGAVVSSVGKVEYHTTRNVEGDEAYRCLSIAAPYLDVVEEMTLTEFLRFHVLFKPLLPEVELNNIISIMGLQKAAHKQIRYFSSGMKQRVKLLQAIFSDTPCLLLDEPCTNLDEAGIGLYHQLITDYCQTRLVIVSSNDLQEYSFCRNVVNIMDYK